MPRRRGVTVVRQRYDWDCGVAALAMALNVPYADVSAATRATVPTRKRGITPGELEDIAAYLGRHLVRVHRRKQYPQDAIGVLGMAGQFRAYKTLPGMEGYDKGHWVVFKQGVIVDPAGEVWQWDDYLKVNRARPCTLLVEAR